MINALLNSELSPFSLTDYRQSLELCMEYLPKLYHDPDDGDESDDPADELGAAGGGGKNSRVFCAKGKQQARMEPAQQGPAGRQRDREAERVKRKSIRARTGDGVGNAAAATGSQACTDHTLLEFVQQTRNRLIFNNYATEPQLISLEHFILFPL